MCAQKAVSGIGNAGEECGTSYRIIPRPRRNHGAERIRLQFEILGIGARSDLRALPLCHFDRFGVTSQQHRKAAQAVYVPADDITDPAPATAFCCCRAMCPAM